MSVKRAPGQARIKIEGRGRELSELRRRAGLHASRPSRAASKRRVIAAEHRAG